MVSAVPDHYYTLLWTSDQPVAEISDNTQLLQETNIHVPGGFEPAIPVSEQPRTHASDRAATGIGHFIFAYLFLFIY